MDQKEANRRIVVKVGTSTLTRENGSINLRRMDQLACTISDLKGMGYEMILVTSGAIAVGAAKLGMAQRPSELRVKQAAAAVGQCEMMHRYDKFFGEYNQTVAQILLTGEDVKDSDRAEHLHRTFEALLELGCIPIVNENDSVSSAEIETGTAKILGDNDTLSAVVASLCGADLLILLSDINGLYSEDPRTNPDATLIHRVNAVTPALHAMAGGAGTPNGTGGMTTKLTAAETAMAAGVDMVITNGEHIGKIYDIIAGKEIGTRFFARKQTM